MGKRKYPDVLPGQRFGRLVVEVFHHYNANDGRYFYTCTCDCGNSKVIAQINLRKGTTQSCGCITRELLTARSTHRMYKSSEYKIWSGMKQRCQNPKYPGYHLYGGRGITFCPQWESFENFYADMGEKPEGTTLDRIDNSKGYSPDNCRWATSIEQANNKRSNRLIEYSGKTQTLAQWARELGMEYHALRMRFVSGWPVDKAFSTPVISRPREGSRG